MECYEVSWIYLTRVWIHPETTLDYSCIYNLWHRIRPINEHSNESDQWINPCDNAVIGVGVDSTLAHDEMKIMQVLYHSERFPTDEEYELKQITPLGSPSDIKEYYNKAQAVWAQFRSYGLTGRQMAALKKEILCGRIPSSFSSPRNWDEEKKVYEFLYSQGYETRDVLAKMFVKMSKYIRPFTEDELVFIRKKIGWLLYSGADVNAIVSGMTIADILESGQIKVVPEATHKFIGIKELIESHHPKRVADISIHPGDLEMIEAKSPDINWQLLRQMFEQR